MGVCAMSSGATDWIATCYEREFEPKTAGSDEATRMIARMTKAWFHRPPKKIVMIRVLARLR